MPSPTDQEQGNLLANLESYYSSMSYAPPGAGKPSSSRANTTISKRRSVYGDKTISTAASQRLGKKT